MALWDSNVAVSPGNKHLVILELMCVGGEGVFTNPEVLSTGLLTSE